jgi:hypothetical protein
MCERIHQARLEAWRNRLASYDPGQMSRADWCKANGISLDRFRYWQGRLGEGGHPSVSGHGEWLSIETDRAPADAHYSASSASGVRVYIGGARIEVASGFDPAVLAAVVRALEAGRC